MPYHKNQIIPLQIDSISSDGSGVGRHEGKVIFVPNTAVGDVLQVQILKDTKTHAFARVHQIVTPGEGRVKPDCPISATCGGCSFRHLSYEAELAAKRGFVQDALQRIGHLDIEVPPVLPSPAQNRYRNKAQYPVAANAGGELVYGFYAARSHRIIPCADCLLQPEILNQIAARSAQLLSQMNIPAYNEATHTGLVRHIYLRRGGHSGQIMLCLVLAHPALPHAEELASILTAEFPEITTILLNINTAKTNVILGRQNTILHGPGFIEDSLCGVPLRLGPFSFSQVNTPGAEQLFGLAKAYAALQTGDTLLDLYCGAGVIGLSMATDAKQLIGIEVVPESIKNARASAQQMGLSNTRFLCADAGEAAAQLAVEGIRPTVITADPPRKGCDEATINAMLQMAPQRIVMVSCNPATLARDLAALSNGGYHVQKLQPVDLFPRTKHVETVVLLSHKDIEEHVMLSYEPENKPSTHFRGDVSESD